MQRHSFARGQATLIGLLTLFLIGAVLAGGCGSRGASQDPDGPASIETTAGEFPEAPVPSQQPPPPRLTEPRTAVYSYLVWISHAYRVLNSNVASPTFTPEEGVRVDSYVQYNRQEDRAIDQRLVAFTPKEITSEGSTATVSAREEWVYRYINITNATYESPVHSVTYDTTYTVVRQNGAWRVQSVEASSVGPPPK